MPLLIAPVREKGYRAALTLPFQLHIDLFKVAFGTDGLLDFFIRVEYPVDSHGI